MNIPFPRMAILASLVFLLPGLSIAGDRGIQRLDTDSNGQISRDEATLAPRLALVFESVDANRDQQLASDELVAFRERARAARREAMLARFARLDADANGRIEGAELGPHPRLQRLDRNADGAVDVEEWPQPRGRRCGGKLRG